MNLRHNMSVTQSVRRCLLAVPLTLGFGLASAQTYSFGRTSGFVDRQGVRINPS